MPLMVSLGIMPLFSQAAYLHLRHYTLTVQIVFPSTAYFALNAMNCSSDISSSFTVVSAPEYDFTIPHPVNKQIQPPAAIDLIKFLYTFLTLCLLLIDILSYLSPNSRELRHKLCISHYCCPPHQTGQLVLQPLLDSHEPIPDLPWHNMFLHKVQEEHNHTCQTR